MNLEDRLRRMQGELNFALAELNDWRSRHGKLFDEAMALKAQWQEEILEELAHWVHEQDQCIDELDIERFRLERQQAEEKSNGR